MKHGATAAGRWTSEYRSWSLMLQRCTNPKSNRYHRYGGRGITVCEPWRDFRNFLADMGLKPSPKHTIDRIDNDGNYEPGNCRWASHATQVRNRPRHPNAKLSDDKVREIRALSATESQTALARRYGVCQPTIYKIITGKRYA